MGEAAKRFLIADDHDLMLRTMQLVVESGDGLRVAAQAANGREALQAIEGGHIDAIIMDVDMPELDGLDALRSVRGRDPDLPVLMCSALGEGARQACMDVGATAFCAKEDLRSGLRQLLDLARRPQ